MQARSTALDELINTGALEDYSTQQITGEDDIDRQLRLGSGGTSDVDSQLAAMKRQLLADSGGNTPSSPQG
jgi:hypothetical protein